MHVTITMAAMDNDGAGEFHVMAIFTKTWRHHASTTGHGGILLAQHAALLEILTTSA